jgi:hypothetical protein
MTTSARQRRRIKRPRTLALPALCAYGLWLSAWACSASALTPAPGWQLTSRSYPTHLVAGMKALLRIDVYNIGAAPSTGAITVTDRLPAGLTATAAGNYQTGHVEAARWKCTGTTVVTCTNNLGQLPEITPGQSENNGHESIAIEVEVAPGAGASLVNQVSIAGGGAANTAQISEPLVVSSQPAEFGFAGFDGWLSDADGTIDKQAGSHPYEVTISLDFNTTFEGEGEVGPPVGGEVKDLEVRLPPGLIGNSTAMPQCTRQQFDARRCPANAQVGFDTAFTGPEPQALPVYNLAPPPGVPAEFGFTLSGISTFLDTAVRSNGDYGITEHAENLAQRKIISNSITLWGVPTESSHDALRRAPRCHTGCPSNAAATPLLTLPTSCEGPGTIATSAVTWRSDLTSEASFLTHDAAGTPTGFSGCDELPFSPSLTIIPEATQSETPTGLTAEVRMPQEGLLNAAGTATADLRDTTIELPEGLAVNPGQASGLDACRQSEDGVGTENAPSCPASSKLGTVTVTTPLLADKLEGSLYLLASNPPDIKLLAAASADGLNLKVPGEVHLDTSTGRLTATFANMAQLPFMSLRIAFNGGARGALVTPAHCGTYTTHANFTPWSSPAGADALGETSFAISSGPGGAACGAAFPFAPALSAGTVDPQGGAFTPFTTTLVSHDGEDTPSTVRVTMPPGLLAMLASVPLCGEAQANAGSCPAASWIGHTIVSAGPGNAPIYLPVAGQPPNPVYLTGPYHGAPFGLSVAIPAIAGPFNLGTVVVRAAIYVDRETAQATIMTGPLPQILAGVPLHLRTISMTIDRPGFIFNPSNCAALDVSSRITGASGRTANVTSPFEATNCATLPFKPTFTASTDARTSKALGAGLTVKIGYPAGVEANLRKLNLQLPKALPTQLKTLTKACAAAQFNANPSGCPPASNVARVVAHTPVLKSPLAGPVYLVSHGNAEFPDVEMVLQAEGVTIVLDGKTQIKKGITYSHFETIPDAPISSFELIAPRGKFALFTAIGAPCNQKLVMPTVMIAQNGAKIERNTRVEVQGCPRSLAVVWRKVKGRMLTMSVYAPSAGTVTASGRGVSRNSKTYSGPEALRFKLRAISGSTRRRIALTFKPISGRKQMKAIRVAFRH